MVSNLKSLPASTTSSVGIFTRQEVRNAQRLRPGITHVINVAGVCKVCNTNINKSLT